jgi:uncharacterized protein involved in response to NO
MATMQKLRAYQGPALFSHGFRPFFLFGAIYAGAMVPLWLAVFAGDVSLPTAFAPRDWHVHEMLFGYVGAVIAGFLLTAVPNWTGRLPIQEAACGPVRHLACRRLAVTFSASSVGNRAGGRRRFLLLLQPRPPARSSRAQWSNLKVVGIISLLAVANIAFRVEAHLDGLANIPRDWGLVVTPVCVMGADRSSLRATGWRAANRDGCRSHSTVSMRSRWS